jgi:hypothetical protein
MKRLNVVVLAPILASGCAIVEPYGRGISAGIYDCTIDGVVAKKDRRGRASEETTCQLAPGAASLPRAIATAQVLQKKYIRAAGEHELIRTAATATVIGGASYALLMGVSDGIAAANATDQIAAIGAGAAAMIAVTNLTTSPRRQDVWLAGAKAVSCAVGRSTPFLLEGETVESLETTVFDLADEIVALRRLRAEAAASKDAGKPDFVAAIADADAAIAAGDLRGGQGAQVLYMRNTGASTGLLNALREIDSDVNIELRKAQPDINAIIASVDGLKGFAAKISGAYAPAPTTASDGQTKSQDFESAADLLAELKVATAEVRLKTDAVRAIVGPVIDAAAAAGAPSACNLEAIIMPISVEPATVDFTAGAAANKIVKIVGGDAPFVADLAAPAEGVGESLDSPFSRDLLISATDKAKGPATIIVKDRTGMKTQVTVNIKPAPKPAPQ